MARNPKNTVRGNKGAKGGKVAAPAKDMGQRVYEVLAEAGYSQDQILEMDQQDALSLAIREKPDAFPEYAEQAQPNADPAAAAAAGAAPGPAAPSDPGNPFDSLAADYHEIMQLTGAPPDLEDAINLMVQGGMDPQVVAAELTNRGVDVSPFLKDAAPPAGAPEAPPNNLPAPEAAPVESVTDMPEPDATAPAPAVTPAEPEPVVAQADADPRIAQLQAMDFDTDTMSPEAIDLTYQSLKDQGYIQDPSATTPQPDAQQVADSLRTPIMDAIERASDPNAMPGQVAPSAQSPEAAFLSSLPNNYEQLRLLSGMTPTEAAYRHLSEMGVTDETLGRMRDEQIIAVSQRMRALQAGAPLSSLIGDADVPAPAPQPQPTPVSRLADTGPSIAEALFPPESRLASAGPAIAEALFPQRNNPASPAPPAPEPAATTQPTARLLDNASAAERTPASFAAEMASGKKIESPEDIQFFQNNAAEIEAALRQMASPAPQADGPLEMPTSPNPYGPDIYTQLQMATFGPDKSVQVRYSPDVPPMESSATPRVELPPGYDAILNDPSIQLNTPVFSPLPPAPPVLDVGAGVPGGVAGAAPPPPGGGGGGGGRGGRIIRALMGTPAQEGKEATLGLVHPQTLQMFSGEDGKGFGMVGKASRAITSPMALRLATLAALGKYISGTKGGLIGQGGVAGPGGMAYEAGKSLMYGTGEQDNSQDNDNVDYMTNYRAALDRLSRPMDPDLPLSRPMVPNRDRPQR